MAAIPATVGDTELFTVELPEQVRTGCSVRLTLPDGRMAVAVMPDTATIQGCGLAMQRRLQVRVAKAPPPPERAPGGGSPVRLHPTALLPSIIESVTGTVAEVHSRTAVTAVRILPTKPTKARAGSKRLRRGKHLQRAGHCLQVCPSS